MGVLQQLHNLHLPEDLFQVLVIQLGLIHDFYGHLETREARMEGERRGSDGIDVK